MARWGIDVACSPWDVFQTLLMFPETFMRKVLPQTTMWQRWREITSCSSQVTRGTGEIIRDKLLYNAWWRTCREREVVSEFSTESRVVLIVEIAKLEKKKLRSTGTHHHMPNHNVKLWHLKWGTEPVPLIPMKATAMSSGHCRYLVRSFTVDAQSRPSDTSWSSVTDCP